MRNACKAVFPLIGALTVFFSPQMRAELIPANRLTDWTAGVQVGVPGGIPNNRTRLIDVTKAPYNADNTGTRDCTAAFGAAFAASSEGDVIYFPAGRFRFNGGFGTGMYQHNRTIRGAGMDVTFIDSRATSGPAINIGTGSSFNYPTAGNMVTAGLTKGSTSLTIGNTSEFTVGQLVQIEFENQIDDALIRAGVTPVISVSGTNNSRRQMTRVTAKSATKLTISPGLYHEPVPGLSAKVTLSAFYTVGMGLEDFTLLNADNTAVFGIAMQDCVGSWIRNVKAKNASNYHVYLSACLQTEIRGCYFSDRKVGGTNGAGILMGTSSGCLIEDNIVEKVGPNIEVNHGSSGNVFAYNVFDGSGMNINHGPHNSFNLYEGNISPWVQTDGYFGGSSDETLFRNWLSGTYYDKSVQTFIISLNRFARNFSIVGNIIGNPAWPYGELPYSFGNPNMGNSSYEGTHQMSKGIFPKDWKMTAVLTKRTTDSSGELKLNSGTLRVKQFRAYMNSGSYELVISQVNGANVTFSTTGGSLPPVGSTLSIDAGIEGFQDLDLDVAATTILKGNYHLWNLGGMKVPSTQALGADTLPASLFRSSKPAYFADDQPWPVFDPARGEPSFTSIPAGRRFVNQTVSPPPPGPIAAKPSNVRIIRN